MRNTIKSSLAIFMAFIMLTGTAALAADTAPVAENLELTTYRNTSVGGRMAASAAKGSSLRFEITTEPTKGSLEVREDGHFVYTPKENKKGRDYFGYKAVDENGNESQEATVIIRIQRKEPAIRYDDTQTLACDYAAGKLAEAGIFTGIQVGSCYYFQPEEIVSQNEFVAICQALDESAPEKRAAFAAEYDSLDYGEAAVIMNDLLQISPVPCLNADTLSDVPENYARAVSNLEACGILETESAALNEPLTRQEAAQMILRAMDILQKR